MTDTPSKDQLTELKRYHAEIVEIDGAECEAMSLTRWAIDEIERLQRENDTCGLQCSATMKSLMAENEQLRTALTGISTCSTCEACRGAALRALGERTVAEVNAAVDERLDRVERELAQPHEIHIGVGGAKHDGSLPDCDLCAVPAEPLCPHGMPLAENICGPCSEGRPNRASRQSKYKPGPGGNNI